MTDLPKLFKLRQKILEQTKQGFTFCCDCCPVSYAEMVQLIEGRTTLESRIRQQKHTITVLQGKQRERNIAMARWHEGREALLRQQLQQATSAMYGWKNEYDRLKAVRDTSE